MRYKLFILVLCVLLFTSTLQAADLRVQSVTVNEHGGAFAVDATVKVFAGSMDNVILTILLPRAVTVLALDQESKCKVNRDGVTGYDTSVQCNLGTFAEDDEQTISITTTTSGSTGIFGAFVEGNSGDEDTSNNYASGSS